MQEQQKTIINKLGLHARSASKLVSIASTYSSEVHLVYKDKCVNAKRIMELLMLGAKQGEQIVVKAEGKDEAEAIAAISELIDNCFEEEQ